MKFWLNPGMWVLALFNALAPRDRGVMRIARDVAYGADPLQRYDVYAPRARGPWPLLVFFYGGGWSGGDKAVYGWMASALAAMGYVVVVPDYRLVPQVRFPGFLADSAEAVRHAAAQAGRYEADARRPGLIGHSAGAYNAVMLCLDPQWLPDIEIAACVGLSGPYDFYPFDVRASREAFGQWPDPQATQPVHFARATPTRFLLVQGGADTIVGPHNAVNLARRLNAAGGEVTLRLHESLNHQDTAALFARPFRHRGAVYQEVRTFLRDEVQVSDGG